MLAMLHSALQDTSGYVIYPPLQLQLPCIQDCQIVAHFFNHATPTHHEEVLRYRGRASAFTTATWMKASEEASTPIILRIKVSPDDNARFLTARLLDNSKC